MWSLVFVFLGISLISPALGAGVVCRDNDGNAVDWYYASKLPRNETDPNPDIAYGDAYTFMLSSQPGLYDWTLSTIGADSEQSMMGRTLSPIYTDSRSPDLVFVLYNDEDPDGNTSFTKGHSKGVLAADQDGGFWMVQNVPKYPGWADGPYTYPSSGHMYGQGFLCFTINVDQVDKIGTQFQYSIPNIFDYAMPSWSQTAFPNLYDAVVNEKEVQSEPWYSIIDIISSGGVTFTSFSKHINYGKDVYADLIAPTLNTNLSVETWNHGDDELPSECSPYHVHNIDAVYVSPVNYTFDNYYDHSKWAVAPDDATVPWICVGDNNRMESQESRAGVTVCQQAAEPWSAYTRSVAAVEMCPM